MDQRRISVVIADAEFLPHVHTVDFLPQRLVPGIVKIKAPDQILPVPGMFVRFCDSPQALPDHQQIRIIDCVLPFMPIVCFQRIHLLLSSVRFLDFTVFPFLFQGFLT